MVPFALPSQYHIRSLLAIGLRESRPELVSRFVKLGIYPNYLSIDIKESPPAVAGMQLGKAFDRAFRKTNELR